jgi:predicted alpha/beta-hydrolase family hydrolase
VVVQGTRDPFGSAHRVGQAVAGVRVRAVPSASHDLAPVRNAPVTPGECEDLLVAAALESVHLARQARE